ncbi:hypothetical protein CYY_000632 [Polysphondylium violaceum]|uniref:RRM domain-containing protein n=1 Tax=Polysphondylium violaceum TaxID=133409 RepID=A0A8J4Q1H4_9MYCE|nr:hypothetical protein CYY_000632 [Polysphondylium violaceum]
MDNNNNNSNQFDPVDQDALTNLIVNNIPKTLDSDGLKVLFEKHGPLASYKVVYNRKNTSPPTTNTSTTTGAAGQQLNMGYGFVKFVNPDHASIAISSMNGYEIEPMKPIKVSYAQPTSAQSSHANLYINRLEPHITKEILKELFVPFGDVSESRILVDPTTGNSRCVGFVHFTSRRDALKAVTAMNGAIIKQQTTPIYVKFADQKEESNTSNRSKPNHKGFNNSYNQNNHQNNNNNNSNNNNNNNFRHHHHHHNNNSNNIQNTNSNININTNINNNHQNNQTNQPNQTNTQTSNNNYTQNSLINQNNSNNYFNTNQGYNHYFNNSNNLTNIEGGGFNFNSTTNNGGGASNFMNNGFYDHSLNTISPPTTRYDQMGLSSYHQQGTYLQNNFPTSSASSFYSPQQIDPSMDMYNQGYIGNMFSMFSVHISNLAVEIEENYLYKLFGPFGALSGIQLIGNGQAIVNFMDYDSAQNAINNLNGKIFSGRPIQVVFLNSAQSTTSPEISANQIPSYHYPSYNNNGNGSNGSA